jgi:hypothetical protein
MAPVGILLCLDNRDKEEGRELEEESIMTTRMHEQQLK